MSFIVPPPEHYPPMPELKARQHMDVISFFKALIRFCRKQKNCDQCPIPDSFCGQTYADDLEMKFVLEAVEIVESWSAKNPQQTNREKFAEVFGKCVEEIPFMRDWLDKPYEEQESEEVSR